MGRDTSPWINGHHWLDKRRDGRAAGIWQIATYSPKSRSVVYNSTGKASLDEAKPVIDAYCAELRAKRPQRPEEAEVAPQLMLYWQERGAGLINAESAAISIRLFFSFLGQDDVGERVTFAETNPQLFHRFAKWRAGPHDWNVVWGKRTFSGKSAGVTPATVQRNLNDLRAALNHAAANGRVPFAPKVPSLTVAPPSIERPLTMEQLGAIYGYARTDKPLWQWLCTMLATGARPEAALAFDPALQANADTLDMHPPAWPRTKKRNAVVPLIEPMCAIIDAWQPVKVSSHKTAWRKLRSLLKLPAHVVPKSIRHTVATELLARGVVHDEISRLLAHSVMRGTTALYAQYRPDYLASVRIALTTLFADVMAAADKWDAVHLRTTSKSGTIEIVKRMAEN